MRGHIFNNGKPAANAGLGLRYIDSRVWGGNVYYDYRKTSHHKYNQVSFGLESLGRYLDYRVNGYFPLGKHKSSLYDSSFDSFSGHSLYIARKQELALKGGNAELGIHIAKVKGIDFYSALGPYYFGNSSKHTFGGEFRIGMDVLSILRIEGSTSYDHLFKWIGQGQISLSYAFTPKTMSRKQKKGSCSRQNFVRDRAFQRVDKQEIIVVSTQKKKSVAVNPATGLPYVFWFVDNTSHSLGTYESPFNTLAAAQSASHPNDIIAVLPGDGTERGMNNGITLQDGQKLWGMSVVHSLPTTLGTIRVKPIASQMPLLSNTLGGVGGSYRDVVKTGNNNEVIGLRVADTIGGNGIFVGGSGSYVIENNIISTINSDGSSLGQGIQLNSSLTSSMSAMVVNNTFLGADGSTNTYGMWLKNCSGNFIISNNVFKGINANTGLSACIVIDAISVPLHCSIIDNNMNFSSNITNGVGGIIVSLNSPATNTTLLVADNKVTNVSFGLSAPLKAGIGFNVQGSFSITLRNNQVTPLNPTQAPPYLFKKGGTASLSQINFAPDNIGTPTYSGF
jgi:hypothetical protein